MRAIKYFIYRFFRIFSRVVLFKDVVVVFSGGNFGYSMHAKSNYDYVCGLPLNKKIIFISSKSAAIGYGYKSFFGLMYLHFSKFIITDNSIPYSVNLQNKTVIQTWHGMPLKRIGLDDSFLRKSLHGYEIRALLTQWKDTSHIISCGSRMTSIFKSAFSVSESSIYSSITPYFLSLGAVQISQYKCDQRNVRSILYFPTYRDWDCSRSWDMLDNKRFVDLLTQFNVMVYYKYHPLDCHECGRALPENFIEISPEDDVFDIMRRVDLFITDYSSSLFDALYLNKPLALYCNDLNDMCINRGMYDLSMLDSFVNLNDLDVGEIESILRNMNVLRNNVYESERMNNFECDSDCIIASILN